MAEYDKDTTAVFVMHGIQKYKWYVYELQYVF
jgi:hypothetical protein